MSMPGGAGTTGGKERPPKDRLPARGLRPWPGAEDATVCHGGGALSSKRNGTTHEEAFPPGALRGYFIARFKI